MSSATPTLVPIRNQGQARAIVFVNGIGGDPIRSWVRFPDFLSAEESLRNWDIFSINVFFSPWRSATRSLRSFADRLYLELCLRGLRNYQQLALITRADAGLITQLAVLDHEDLAERLRAQ